MHCWSHYKICVLHLKSTSIVFRKCLYNLAEVELRTQGSRLRPRTQKNPRPRPKTDVSRTDHLEAKDRSGMLEAKDKDKGHRRKCSQKKRSSKKIFWTISKNRKKKSSQTFREVFGVFQRNFNDSNNSGNFQELEASTPRPRTRPSRPRPRTSKCVFEDVLEVKDVLDNFTSVI